MTPIRTSQNLSEGLRIPADAIARAQHRFAGAAAEIARQGAIAGNQLSTSASQAASPAGEASFSGAPTPPNPGPPGGAYPADLAQAMVDQKVAKLDLSANVKTLQAFDEMLDELTRIKR